MPIPVLVTYASPLLSTDQIATHIASTLSQTLTPETHTITCLPLSKVTWPKDEAQAYKAIILGTTLQNSNLEPAAQRFLEENVDVLYHTPTYAFVVGTSAGKTPLLRRLLGGEDKEKEKGGEKVSLCLGHKVPCEVLEGKVERGMVKGVGGLLWGCFGGKYGDFINWQKVEEYAHGVGEDLLAKKF